MQVPGFYQHDGSVASCFGVCTLSLVVASYGLSGKASLVCTAVIIMLSQSVLQYIDTAGLVVNNSDCYLWGFTIISDPCIDPQIVGSLYSKDPKKVPLIFVDPQLRHILTVLHGDNKGYYHPY